MKDKIIRGDQDIPFDEWCNECEKASSKEQEIYNQLLYEMAIIVEAFKGNMTLYKTNAYFTITVLEKDVEMVYLTLSLAIIEDIVESNVEICKPSKHLSGFSLIMNSKIEKDDLNKMFDKSLMFWEDLENKFKN